MTTPTPQNIEQAQTYIDFVKKNLEPMAHQIGVSVQWLWDVLVNQARVEAITWLVVLILGSIKVAILATIAFKSLKKATFQYGYSSSKTVYKHKKTGAEIKSLLEDWDNSKEYQEVKIDNSTNTHGRIVYMTGIPAAVLAVILVFVSMATIPTIVTGLVNPQYRAIERVVEFAKGNTANGK